MKTKIFYNIFNIILLQYISLMIVICIIKIMDFNLYLIY